MAAYGLVGEIGYLIAIPAVLFGFGGAYLDKQIHTTPLFMLLGLCLAFVTSGMAVWRIVKKLQERDAAIPAPKNSSTPNKGWEDVDEEKERAWNGQP